MDEGDKGKVAEKKIVGCALAAYLHFSRLMCQTHVYYLVTKKRNTFWTKNKTKQNKKLLQLLIEGGCSDRVSFHWSTHMGCSISSVNNQRHCSTNKGTRIKAGKSLPALPSVFFKSCIILMKPLEQALLRLPRLRRRYA